MVDVPIPAEPPGPDRVEEAMDIADSECDGLMGPSATACRGLVTKWLLMDDASRQEVSARVSDRWPDAG